jgi:Complex 1 protein (LYR family)
MRPIFPMMQASRHTSTSSRFRKPALSLDQFLQRQRVISLWRDIVRATNKIPPSSTRDEMRRYAREGFERNRSVTDLTQIRYLISTGKTEFEGMQRYVDELAAR